MNLKKLKSSQDIIDAISEHSESSNRFRDICLGLPPNITYAFRLNEDDSNNYKYSLEIENITSYYNFKNVLTTDRGL